MRKIISATPLLLLCFFNTNLFAQGVQQLWGMTYQGGANRNGTIISASATGSNQQLRSSFDLANEGMNPEADLTSYNSKMYGMTPYAGVNDLGVIFEWDPATNIYTKKIDLSSTIGSRPHGSLVLYNSKLYGMTSQGGANGVGVIFEWAPATNVYVKKIDLSTANGSSGVANLIVYNSKLYGMTNSGGANGGGVIFEWDPATNVYIKKIDLSSTNGAGPWGSLVLYNSKLYGMTTSGGINGNGVIFEWNPATNIYTKKIDLTFANGWTPYGSLVVYNSKLYGMTHDGGANAVGVIFEWNPATNVYTKKIDMSFTIGSYPRGSLIVYNSKLYGMTSSGYIVIFEWDPATNVYTRKFSFGGLNGDSPLGSLVLYNNKMYGMTSQGGINYAAGVIFEWTSATNVYVKKIDFAISVNGSYPMGNLLAYNNKMYGVTPNGGVNEAGVIFEWDPATNVYTKKIDLSFSNGGYPYCNLVLYNSKLYGITPNGGVNGLGVIFEWVPATNVYTKKIDLSSTIGSYAYGSMLVYNSKLYGMTQQGGANGVGVIFEWDPATNVYTKKMDFNSTNGAYPRGNLVVYNNKLYGMTQQGGANGVGVIFEWDPVTNVYVKKIDMSSTNGFYPYGSVVVFNNKLYGMTSQGGANGIGVIFEWDPATNVYAKKIDLSSTIGSYPYGSLVMNNNKMYGMTSAGGINGNGVIFEWDPATNVYSKKSDLTSDNGSTPRSDLIVINAPVAKGSPPVCQTLPTITIDNTNNNIWVPIVDSKGDIAAEIKANGNNLGVVNTDLFTKTGACREDNNFRLYLNRNITITPQTPPSSNVDVRLYIRKSELDTIKTAMNSQSQPSGVASINEIGVFKNNNTCSVTVGNAATPLTATSGTYGVDYYLQVSVSSFSTFYFANKALVAILPVQLFSFNGIRQTDKNLLQWKATCFAKTAFTLQRSKNGIDFENLGILYGSDSDINKVYEFIDNSAGESKWYYRLLIEETGVQQKYSQTITLGGNDAAELTVKVAPNPVVNGLVNMNISSALAGFADIKLLDMQGKVIGTQQLNFQAGFSNANMYVNKYANGIYHLVFTSSKGYSIDNKLVIVK